MRELILTLAVLLIIGWGIGFFGYQFGGFFHLILMVALLALLFQFMTRNR